MIQFSRIQADPVLSKYQSFGGWFADALAAPSVCWDGAQFVMTLSVWNSEIGVWVSVFLASADLVNWTYIDGSVQTPQGGDYIIGNGGLAWFLGKYWWAYNHYPSGGSGDVTIATSTDLLTWTVVTDTMVGAPGYDPSLCVNPNTGDLEIWYVTNARNIALFTTSDGAVFHDQGQRLDSVYWNVTDFGEPQAYYVGGVRHLTFDGSPHTTGVRFIGHATGSPLVADHTVLGPDSFNSWESVQTFDSCVVGAFDVGDGRGTVLWMVYAGSDIAAATDSTNSSIGLSFQSLDSSGGGLPVRALSGLSGLTGTICP